MKKILCFLMTVLMLLPFFCACGGAAPETATAKKTPASGEETAMSAPETSNVAPAKTPTPEPTSEPTSEPTPEPTPSPEPTTTPAETPEGDLLQLEYGVYNILSADGEHKLALNNKNQLIVNDEDEIRTRFTVHAKERKGERYYAIYKGDDEVKTLAINSVQPGKSKVTVTEGRYTPADKDLWSIVDCGYGVCRIIPMMSPKNQPLCLELVGNEVQVKPLDEANTAQLFRIEKAGEHPEFIEFRSDGGKIFIRLHRSAFNKSTGITEEHMQRFVNFFEEAYYKEIELTGYIPYDIIVINGWEDIKLAAGVSDNYNVITAGRAFMNSEMSNSARRWPLLEIFDLSFGMLHEMGHMFDSNRGWNFESEAWTDLKLCYVIYKMTLEHKTTDGITFGCSSSDYPTKICHVYETMADGLNIHAKKGAMTTVYGFFGAARLFLLMAYDFGWEPFIKTFHWFQDNGYTAKSFERWERFTTFCDKLSEFSGRDIMTEYLTPENIEVFRAYYQGETTAAV